MSQRRLARAILGVLVGLLAAFLLFSTGPIRGISFAQPTTRFEINFVNPDNYGGEQEISTKDDGFDNAYHLVAWIDEVPAAPTVEFRYQSGDDEITIGDATSAGSNTYEFFWDTPDELPDGSITLIAVLFDGGTEVARDVEPDFLLNDKDPAGPTGEQEAQGETVEITYPENASDFGFYKPRDEITAGIVQVSFSEGTLTVNVAYSTSVPGEEPSWVECASEDTGGDVEDGIRCELSASDDLEDVTAIAAQTNDNPFIGTADNDDSGDAHRVLPYAQEPTSLSLDPTEDDEAPEGDCSEPFTATVLDQNGRPIPNANVDVHAQGPDDALAFDSGHLAPTGEGHETEPAADCAGDAADAPPDADGEQGDHELGDANDIKHVENVTDDAGQMSFQLFSPARGGTQLTAWSDDDDNDLHCEQEASDDGSVGWQENAPAVTGLSPDQPECPGPQPSTSSPGPTTSSPGPTDGENPRGCTLQGTSNGEQLRGTPGDDVICGGGGNDIILGRGGNDILYGDGGRDSIRGGGGNDRILGGGGKDRIRAGAGNDVVKGQGGTDTAVGGPGDDRINGNARFDTLRGSAGNDLVIGGQGKDVVLGGGGNDDLRGNAGRDTLRGGRGRDRCRGGPGRDTITGCER